MANVNFGAPISGISGVVPGATEAERNAAYQRKLVADQLAATKKIQEQQAAQLKIQQEQAALAAQQAKQKPNPSFIGRVATATVTAGAAAVIAGEVIEQNPELLNDTQQRLAEILNAQTPATTSLLGVNRSAGPNTPASNSRKLEIDIDQALNARRILDQYQVRDEETRRLVETNTIEASSAFRAIQNGVTKTTTEQANEIDNVLIDFHRTVETNTLRAIKQDQKVQEEQARAQAKRIADEVTAQLVRDNRLQSERLAELDRVHRQKEDERRNIAAKEEAIAEQTARTNPELRPKTNLDPGAQAKVDALRNQQLQTKPDGSTFDPTTGVYVDPHRESKKPEFEKPAVKDQVAPIDARVFSQERTETGEWVPSDDHSKIDSLGANLGQASDRAGLHTGDHATPVAATEVNGAVRDVRAGGQLEPRSLQRPGPGDPNYKPSNL